jgi:hypothetical protein
MENLVQYRYGEIIGLGDMVPDPRYWIVVNRNTIPGDESAADPSGIRMGTPWVTPRGFKEPEIKILADIIADILLSTKPHGRMGASSILRRAKVDFRILEEGKMRVRDLAEGQYRFHCQRMDTCIFITSISHPRRMAPELGEVSCS